MVQKHLTRIILVGNCHRGMLKLSNFFGKLHLIERSQDVHFMHPSTTEEELLAKVTECKAGIVLYSQLSPDKMIRLSTYIREKSGKEFHFGFDVRGTYPKREVLLCAKDFDASRTYIEDHLDEITACFSVAPLIQFANVA